MNRPAMLVMPLSCALGLAAGVNGEAVPVWRANGALSGALLPQGRLRVEVRALPDSHRWIAISQVIGVVALFSLLAAMMPRRRGGERAGGPSHAGANG